jgi:transcriptional regulator with XRE-family HTH domain
MRERDWKAGPPCPARWAWDEVMVKVKGATAPQRKATAVKEVAGAAALDAEIRSRKVVTETAVTRILDRLKDDGGLQGKDIANIVAVSPATVSRWSSGKATPDLKTQMVIAELRYVVDRLADFYTPDETRLWLHARHPMLHNARAIDLINVGRTEEVLAVIETLDSGAYT